MKLPTRRAWGQAARICAAFIAAWGSLTFPARFAGRAAVNREVSIGRRGLTRTLRIENSSASTVALRAKTEIKTTSTEFELSVAAGGREWVITPSECRLESAAVAAGGEGLRLIWASRAPPLEIEALYTSARERPYILKQVMITNRGSEPVRIRRAVVDELKFAGGAPMRGGVGQPVTLRNEFFFGIEHPAAANEARGENIVLTEFPDAEVAVGATWSSAPAVLGAATQAEESVENAFSSYLATRTGRGPKFRALYCDWAAHDEMGTLVKPQLTEALTFKLLDALELMKTGDGIQFDDYTLDAFWYDPQGGFVTFKQPNWPRGFEPALVRIRRQGMKPGLWFDLGGGTLDLQHTPDWKGPDHPCLSDPGFAELLEKALAVHIRRHGLSLIEFDFAHLECTHSSDESSLAVMKKNADALREIIRKARAMNPSLVIRAYNTFSSVPLMESTNLYDESYAVSPWWLLWFDSLYSGDPRPADIPSVTSLRDSVNWYQDHVFRGFERSWMPAFDIDDSGTLVGKTSTIYYLGAEGFTDSWILNVMRGDLSPTFFGDPTLLTENDRKFLAATLRFARQHEEVLSHTAPILGVPGRGEVYGYLARGRDVSFMTTVNPGLFDQSAVVSTPGAGEFEKLIFSNGSNADPAVEPAGGTLATTLIPGEIRVVAFGSREKLEALSLPAAPTRLFRRVETMPDPFRERPEARMAISPERAGETLALILRYFRGGLADRSSKQPQDVVKVSGEINGRAAAFDSIPRKGTDIWSGCSWAVFKHLIAPEEGGQTLDLKLVGSPPEGTTLTITALWLIPTRP